jgi:predicted RNase H-like HicB family nuclease
LVEKGNVAGLDLPGGFMPGHSPRTWLEIAVSMKLNLSFPLMLLIASFVGLLFKFCISILPARRNIMERIINIHVEKLPDGFYLATSNEVQGLVAQGRTIAEVMEIARDVARRLLEAQQERKQLASEPELADSFDLPLVVGS